MSIKEMKREDAQDKKQVDAVEQDRKLVEVKRQWVDKHDRDDQIIFYENEHIYLIMGKRSNGSVP